MSFSYVDKETCVLLKDKGFSVKNFEVVAKNCSIDVSPHSLTSACIVMTNARVFHNNEIHNNVM